MLHRGIKLKPIILTVLAMFGAVNLSVLANTKTSAQAQADSTKVAPCIANNIRLYILLANNGSSSAFNKLVACNSKAIPYLVQALESKDENLRIISIAALGEIDTNAAALPYLTKSLKDSSKDVRVVTAYYLGKIGKDAVPVLTTALKDENSYVRRSAADALERIVPDCTNCVYNFVPLLRKHTLFYLRNKPPVMCRIPVINNLLAWKCSDANFSEGTSLDSSPKPENLPQLMQGESSPDTQKPCKNCSNSQDKQ